MTAKIIDQNRISQVVPLEYPIEFEGKIYDAITVRSPVVADIAALSERISAESGTPMRLPMFGDTPDEVLDALHLDDDDRLTEVAGRFLPRRFRAPPASGSDNGAPSPTP